MLQSMGLQTVRHSLATEQYSNIRVCRCVCVCARARARHLQLFVTPWTIACQVPLSVGFLRQHCSRLPLSSLGNFPYPGFETTSPVAPVLADVFFTTETPAKPVCVCVCVCVCEREREREREILFDYIKKKSYRTLKGEIEKYFAICYF